MSEILYDSIGKKYNTTRSADPYLTGRLFNLLSPKEEGHYLDIGCGTANYLTALSKYKLKFTGVDPSETMLGKARDKGNHASFVCAHAESLPFADNTFDGGIATFTLHHWTDKKKGLEEVNRVLKYGSRLVFLSFAGEQMRGYWLNEYFPKMMKQSWELLPELPEMEQLLNDTGFQLSLTEKYFIHDELQDHFLYAHKRQPERYLDENVRQNMSAFSAICTPEELKNGLSKLEADILSGRIKDIMDQYENDKGDYVFLVAEKAI
jgi:ubiquinone/menaquinone biosynthesis C-methylase UbiE